MLSSTNLSPYFSQGSPMGPAMGGYAPTAGDFYFRAMNQQQTSMLNMQSAVASPLVDRITREMARAMVGASEEGQKKFLNGFEGQLTQALVGMAASHNLLGQGRPQDLQYAIANAIAQPGARYTTSTGLRTGNDGRNPVSFAAGAQARVYGMGLLNNMSAQAYMGALQEHLFDKDGYQILERTAGRGYAGAAEALSYGTRNGLFNEGLTGDIVENSRGEKEVKIDQGMVKRMRDFIQEGNQAVAAVRDIFGDKSFDELARTLQTVTGIRITKIGDAKKASAQFENIRRQIESVGLDSAGVMQSMTAAAESVALNFGGGKGAEMLGGALSRKLPEVYTSSVLEKQNAYRDVDAIAAMKVRGTSTVLQEMPVLEEAGFYMSREMDSTQRARTEELMRAVGSAESVQEQRSAAQQLGDYLRSQGFSPGSLARTGQLDYARFHTDEAARRSLVDAASSADDNRARKNVRSVLNADNRMFTDRERYNALSVKYINELSGDTVSQLSTLLDAGDTAGATALLDRNSTRLGMSGSAALAQLQEVFADSSQGAAAGRRRFFRHQDQIRSQAYTGVIQNTESRDEAERQRAAAMENAWRFEQTRGEYSFVEALLKGMGGEIPETGLRDMALKTLQANGQALTFRQGQAGFEFDETTWSKFQARSNDAAIKAMTFADAKKKENQTRIREAIDAVDVDARGLVRDGKGGEEVIIADPGSVSAVKNVWRSAIRDPQRFNDLVESYREKTGKDPLPSEQIRALQAEIAKRAGENVNADKKKVQEMQESEKAFGGSNDRFVGYVTLLPGGNSQAQLYRQ